MEYIFELGKVPEWAMNKIGGKALSLDLMIRELRLNVPYGYVVTASAVEDGKIRDKAKEEIRLLESKLSSKDTYAVRSSALSEDGDNASFAGQYETVTDVAAEGILEATEFVAGSADTLRVRDYKNAMSDKEDGIAVVIQRFVKPEMAGVVFTSDPISGRDEYLVGNYVRGEGELLVSGNSNASEFRINAISGEYEGPPGMKPYASRLLKSVRAIRRHYGMPMDIEWAVSGKGIYILQARPITTMRGYDISTYDVNGSKAGYKLLTKTNVGEIFMKPVSPVTYSVLQKISDMIGLPEWLDNVSGQAYMNITVMMSVIVSFGKTKEQAFSMIKDLVGNIPEGLDIPVSPFDRKAFGAKIRKLLFPKNRSKLTKKQKLKMVAELADISGDLIAKIRKCSSEAELLIMWDKVLIPSLNDGLASVLAACGTAMVPLFTARSKISEVAGEEMAQRLISGSLGQLDSMKPMLLIEDIISGRISREDYIRECGHRCVNEMELMEPRPYEDPSFIDERIRQYEASGADLHEMQRKQSGLYEQALAEFKKQYPKKAGWIDKQMESFVRANQFREEIRSKGVWIFCVYREFLLKTGSVMGIGDDVFMLTYEEVITCLKGDKSALGLIPARRANYMRYLEYPAFPALILGRFDPDKWLSGDSKRYDFYCEDMSDIGTDADVKGFAGASGQVRAKVRVISDISRIDEIEKGEVLVTVATNVGWTPIFPKVAAIVTDIGAPLSHAAIVAREFGIPAVVGCGNATTVLKTGDVVTVDGSKGVVRIERQGL